MTFLEVVKKVGGNRSVQRSLLQIKKHSPTILTASGVAGVVVAGIMASRASMNVENLFKQHRDEIQLLKDLKVSETIDEKKYQKELTRRYFDTTKQVVKRYGPAVSLGVVSLAAIVGSHGILRQRNIALGVLYKGAETALLEYRKRVVEEFGEEKDRDYRHGIFHENVVDPETGKKKKVASIGSLEHSEYARFFDETNRNWDPVPAYSMLFLKAQQQYANDILWSRGHLTLNDVYDALGFDRTKGGQLVGWILNKNAPAEDNFVDFGIWDISSSQGRMFVNGDEKVILLDFNVHGVIYDQI